MRYSSADLMVTPFLRLLSATRAAVTGHPRRVLLATLVALIMAGPSKAQTGNKPEGSIAGETSTSVPPASGLEWLEKTMAREVELIQPRPLVEQKGTFRSLVPAKILAPPVLTEGVYYTQLDIGTTVPMECYFYTEPLDMAGDLVALAEVVLGHLEKQAGEIVMRGVEKIEAGAVDGSPFLGLSWMYRTLGDNGPLVWQLKQRLGRRGAGSVYCIHNEVGYSATFARAFEQILGSVQWSASSPLPFYSEIAVVEIRGTPCGIAHNTYTVDEEGDVRGDQIQSLLLQVDARTLSTSDSYDVEFSDPEGQLINELSIDAKQGEISTNLSLAPSEEGFWDVSGILQGKDFSAQIDAQPLLSSYGQALAMRDFMADPETQRGQLSFRSWMPGTDPTVISPITVDFGEKTAEGFHAKLDVAGVVMETILDSQGSAISAKVDLGAISMTLRRIHVEGTLLTP